MEGRMKKMFQSKYTEIKSIDAFILSKLLLNGFNLLVNLLQNRYWDNRGPQEIMKMDELISVWREDQKRAGKVWMENDTRNALWES